MSCANVAGYILAGGLSSRMGRDKAMLRYDGKTLLERAVTTMRGVAPTVTIIGDRCQLEGADRAIMDRSLGCGPLGGMEAALHDLTTTNIFSNCEWASFLPVDMPLLPHSLYAALIPHWLDIANRSNSRDTALRIAYVQTGGTPQPLVSLLHRSILPYLSEALRQSKLKITSVLQCTERQLALTTDDPLNFQQRLTGIDGHAYFTTLFGTHSADVRVMQWMPSTAELATRNHWFSNINTPEELALLSNF